MQPEKQQMDKACRRWHSHCGAAGKEMVAFAQGRTLCVGKELMFCTNVTKNETSQGPVPGGEEESGSLHTQGVQASLCINKGENCWLFLVEENLRCP